MKIRSAAEFEDFVASEYSWRRKEITNLRNITLESRSFIKESLFRSLIPILYAHWEGFVKQTSIAKLKYLSAAGYKYKDLAPSFLAYALLVEYEGQISNKRFDILSKIVSNETNFDMCLHHEAEKFIDAKSNLNSDLLKDILLKIKLDYSKFELKENFIDESFLGLRNKICHGERVKINEENFTLIYDEVNLLIDTFKINILNSVSTKSYLKNPVPTN